MVALFWIMIIKKCNVFQMVTAGQEEEEGFCLCHAYAIPTQNYLKSFQPAGEYQSGSMEDKGSCGFASTRMLFTWYGRAGRLQLVEMQVQNPSNPGISLGCHVQVWACGRSVICSSLCELWPYLVPHKTTKMDRVSADSLQIKFNGESASAIFWPVVLFFLASPIDCVQQLLKHDC